MKRKESNTVSSDAGRVASVVGQKKFKKEVIKEIQAGTDPREAADSISRKNLKGMI